MLDILARSIGYATRVDFPVDTPTASRPRNSSLLVTVARLADRAIAAYRHHHRRSIAIREFRAMNTHLLRDIGLRREDIPAVVDAMLDHEARTADGAPFENVAWRTIEAGTPISSPSGNDNRPDLAA